MSIWFSRRNDEPTSFVKRFRLAVQHTDLCGVPNTDAPRFTMGSDDPTTSVHRGKGFQTGMKYRRPYLVLCVRRGTNHHACGGAVATGADPSVAAAIVHRPSDLVEKTRYNATFLDCASFVNYNGFLCESISDNPIVCTRSTLALTPSDCSDRPSRLKQD